MTPVAPARQRWRSSISHGAVFDVWPVNVSCAIALGVPLALFYSQFRRPPACECGCGESASPPMYPVAT